MLEWIMDNVTALFWAGGTFFVVCCGGLALVHINDRRQARRTSVEDSLPLLGDSRGLNTSVTETAAIPAYGTTPPVSHAHPDEDATAESDEGYVGQHRLPEQVTASYLRAIMTQTQGLPILRQLNPSWRAVTPWPTQI